MTTLDDKLLGEKTHYYCSSSEDENEDEPAAPPAASGGAAPGTANTGPKGVIEDWKQFKEWQKNKYEQREREKIEMAKKMTLACQPLDNQEEEELDEDDEAFLQAFTQRRMRELQLQQEQRKQGQEQFGQLFDLVNGDDFLTAVDTKGVAVIILLYDNNSSSCKNMSECLRVLAETHFNIKFCRLPASAAGLSFKFRSSGLPALLVYKDGELVTTDLIKLNDVLGNDFEAEDVQGLLVQQGLLEEKDLAKQGGKNIRDRDDDEDSD